MIYADFEDEILTKHLSALPKDEMSIFVLADGFVRGAIFHGTRFVNQMRAQHKLGILETMILGQASLCGALMIPMMKDLGRMTMRYEVNGQVEGFSVDAFSDGKVRGYLFNKNIQVTSPVADWNLAQFIGTGTLSVSSIRAGEKEKYTSSVEATHQNIAEDLVWYFEQSEQIKTAFDTSIFMDKNARVVGAGGLFLQVLPEFGGNKNKNFADNNLSTDEILVQLENIVKNAASLGKEFAAGKTPDLLVSSLFAAFSPKIALHREILWLCPCAKETFATHLHGLPLDVLEDLRKNGPQPIQISCQNCGSIYEFEKDEI